MNLKKFNEKLIPIENRADISKLDKAMEKNPKLKKLMTTPMKDLPDEFGGLSYSYFSDFPLSGTLYDVLKAMFSLNYLWLNGKFLYSGTSEDDITGFIYYTVSGTNVTDVGAFSFDLSKGNVVLARDVLTLLKELKKGYRYISWKCFEENPAIEIYKKYCDKNGGEYIYGGKYPVRGKLMDIQNFTIPGNIELKVRESLRNTIRKGVNGNNILR